METHFSTEKSIYCKWFHGLVCASALNVPWLLWYCFDVIWCSRCSLNGESLWNQSLCHRQLQKLIQVSHWIIWCRCCKLLAYWVFSRSSSKNVCPESERKAYFYFFQVTFGLNAVCFSNNRLYNVQGHFYWLTPRAAFRISVFLLCCFGL